MVEQFIEHINNLLEQNKPDKAFEECNNEISKYLDKQISLEEELYLAEIYCTMSGVLASCGKLQEALQSLNCAIAHNCNDYTYFFNRALLKTELNDYEGAISDYTESIKLNESDSTYTGRATLKYHLQDYEGACIDYTQALLINPNYAKGYLDRGVIKACLKDYDNAIIDYDKAIELCPDYALSYALRAKAKTKIGDKEGALKDLKKLKLLEPNNKEARKAIQELTGKNQCQKIIFGQNKFVKKQNNQIRHADISAKDRAKHRLEKLLVKS